MGLTAPFTPEKLMIGLLFHDPDQAKSAKDLLYQHFGSTDLESDIFCFSDHSHYYDQEMQGLVYRQFLSFTTLIDPSKLADIKILTNSLETHFMSHDSRPINIDPGCINTGRLILATTKNAAHRFALSQGIYAELTLFYSLKKWNVLPWTYPDFRTEETHAILSHIRKTYRANLHDY